MTRVGVEGNGGAHLDQRVADPGDVARQLVQRHAAAFGDMDEGKVKVNGKEHRTNNSFKRGPLGASSATNTMIIFSLSQ